MGVTFSSFKRFIDTQLYKEQTVDLEVIPDQNVSTTTIM